MIPLHLSSYAANLGDDLDTADVVQGWLAESVRISLDKNNVSCILFDSDIAAEK
jgi:hypothetical protein